MQAENKSNQAFDALLASSDFDGLFFPGAGRKKAVDSLLHFARYGNMLLFLRGGAGSGRSKVLREFSSSVDRDTQIVYLESIQGKLLDYLADSVDSIAVEVNKLVEQVAALDIDGAEESSAATSTQSSDLNAGEETVSAENATTRISRYVKRLGARGRRLVVVFDDELPLADEDITSLIKIADQNDGVFKLIFSGDNDLASRVGAFSEKETLLINIIDLPEFSVADALAYVGYRLQAAGYAETKIFGEQRVETALRRSEGNLNRFHQMLGDVSLPMAPVRRPAKLPLPHLLLAIGLLGLIGGLWYFGKDQQEFVAEPAPIVLETLEKETPEAIEPRAEIQASVDEVVEVEIEPEKTATAVIAASQGEKRSAESDALQADLASNQRLSDNSLQSADVAPKVDTAIQTTTTSNDDAGIETAELATNNASKTEVDLNNNAAVQTLLAKDSAASNAHAKLLTWPETGYALQVFGTHNAARAAEMVQNYVGKADLVFYETRHNNKPWYAVIAGPYSGSEAARRGIDALPDSLRRLRPWPRNVASIHRDIKRYQQ